jgi:hypothetical protein
LQRARIAIVGGGLSGLYAANLLEQNGIRDAALFGFLGVPAPVRRNVPEDVLRTHCRAQLTRLSGPQAATPTAEVIKDWALDPYTATVADLDGAGHHAEAPAATGLSGPWSGRLTGIASADPSRGVRHLWRRRFGYRRPGAGKDPLTVPAGFLVGGEHRVLGSMTGSPFENGKTLNFSVLTGARPRVETIPRA